MPRGLWPLYATNVESAWQGDLDTWSPDGTLQNTQGTKWGSHLGDRIMALFGHHEGIKIDAAPGLGNLGYT